MLLWPFTASSNSKYTVLLESVGSKVVCVTHAPSTAADNQPDQQQLQQVGVQACRSDGCCLQYDAPCLPTLLHVCT